MVLWKTANGQGNYRNSDARLNAVRYILNTQKMKSMVHGGANLENIDPHDPYDIAEQMNAVAVQFGRPNGVQLRHFIFSFDRYCQVSPQQVGQIAQSLAYFLGREYQTVFAVHENTDNLHFHLISHAISFIDGHRYAGSKAEFYALQNYMKQVLRSYGISTLIYSYKLQTDIDE